MPDLPKISIVTPSLNQHQFLEATIRSVLNQGYPNLEYVVIDGGSTDGSVEIIKKYASQLHYWASEKDNGHGHALNKGFARTSGEIMAWLNSDDMYTPWSFQVAAEIFSTFPHVNWIVGLNSWWNDKGVMTAVRRVPKNIYDFLLGNYAWIQQESVFWRRSLWERAGAFINQDYQFMVDGELWTRFFLHDELYCLDCILSGYRVHDDNRAVRNHDRCVAEMEKSIAVMRARCSREVLATAKTLRLVQFWKEAWPMKRLPVAKAGRRIFRSAHRRASYKTISYEQGHWKESTTPFSV
jgi:glycosyltransferase involved in cell wall biosynthesis